MTTKPSEVYIAFLTQAARIFWSGSLGFGEITFYLDKHNKLHVDSECMSREFVLEAVKILIAEAVFDDEPSTTDPQISNITN